MQVLAVEFVKGVKQSYSTDYHTIVNCLHGNLAKITALEYRINGDKEKGLNNNYCCGCLFNLLEPKED